MTEVRELDVVLKPLEFCGLQFFSLSKIKLNSEAKFPSIGYVFSFLCYLLISIIRSYVFYFEIKKEADGVAGLFEYALDFIAGTMGLLKVSVAVVESFVRVKNQQKFFVLFMELDEFLIRNFNTQICVENLMKTHQNRLRITAAVLLLNIFVGIAKLLTSFGFYDLILVLLLSSLLIQIFLSFYQILLFIDIIKTCLLKLYTTLDYILYYEHIEDIQLKQIYGIKRLYIFIIEMCDELNIFLGATIKTFTLTEILWMSLRYYRLLKSSSKAFSHAIGMAIFIHLLCLEKMTHCHKVAFKVP